MLSRFLKRECVKHWHNSQTVRRKSHPKMFYLFDLCDTIYKSLCIATFLRVKILIPWKCYIKFGLRLQILDTCIVVWKVFVVFFLEHAGLRV